MGGFSCASRCPAKLLPYNHNPTTTATRGVFNVVWLPGVAPVYTVGPGALRAGTLTVDSAASPSASLATLWPRSPTDQLNARTRLQSRTDTDTSADKKQTSVRPPRSGRGAETHQQLSPSHKSSGCPRAKPRAFLSSARTGASSKLRSAVLYLRDG